MQRLSWAARLHEIGLSIAHSGFHKHTAYIVENADMPGFSKKEQFQLSRLVLAQRGSLNKVMQYLSDNRDADAGFGIASGSAVLQKQDGNRLA